MNWQDALRIAQGQDQGRRAYFDERAQRNQAAQRMQAFYEPAYFGKPTNTGGWFEGARTMPTTMGGFNYAEPVPDEYLSGLPAGSPSMPEFQGDFWKQRTAFDTTKPTYGVGQLNNYGVGALRAYRPLASLRRR